MMNWIRVLFGGDPNKYPTHDEYYEFTEDDLRGASLSELQRRGLFRRVDTLMPSENNLQGVRDAVVKARAWVDTLPRDRMRDSYLRWIFYMDDGLPQGEARLQQYNRERALRERLRGKEVG